MKRISLATLFIILAGLLNLTAQERVYTPELSLPENNAVDQMPDVLLDWNAVTGGNTGIIKYDIQLDIDPGFASPVTFETEFLSAVQTENLLFGETYYWRVRAKDGNDVSGWSETRSFRVISRVILTGPNDASTQSTEVEFAWSEVTGVTEYDLQVDVSYYWNAVTSGQTGNLFGVAVVDDTHAWVVGAGGVVTFFDGSAWTEQESSISTDIYSVSFIDATNGWAVGKGGKIIHFDGTSWAAVASGTTNDLNGVHMLTASNGWAVGKAGTVLHYDGTGWSSQYTATKDLNKVFAFDATHVWAVGKSGLIIFYNGTTWAPEETGGTIKEFLNVGFTSATDGWAIGKTGFMMHYTGGTWNIYEHDLTTKDLTGLYFTSPDNAWAVGKSGTVLQYDGIAWFSQTGGTTTNLNSVAFSGNTGFIAGETGSIIAFNPDAFNSPNANTFTIPSENLTADIINFPFGETFFWRMRCRHAAATSDWSGARSFTVQATVELNKPNNHAVDQDLDVELSWDLYSDLVTYDIEIDEDPDFTSPIFLTSNEIFKNAEMLHFGTKYYWRVRALHTGDISDWSEVWDFTTINTVVLLSPADNATDVNLSPLLDWEDITGISNYWAELDDSPDFATPLVSGTVPADQSFAITPLVLEKETSYYWRVRAENGLDYSGWSPTWTFTTIPPVGLEENTFENSFSIFPNPADQTIYIHFKNDITGNYQLIITDVLGVKVDEENLQVESGNLTVPVNVSHLQNGVYMMRISDKDNNSFTKKIVIKR